MEVQVGGAKAPKYATDESGDTLELIERPNGGISAVLVDGQRSGRAAKVISNIAARKAISLLGEGVRDGAVARAAHDYLCTHRRGQVSAELQIVSVDLRSRTLVVSRNTHCPAYALSGGSWNVLGEPSNAIGIHTNTKPVITELALEPGTYAVAFTDGVLGAGERAGRPFDILAYLHECTHPGTSAQSMADGLLAQAMALDDGRPSDDMSVLVVAALPAPAQPDIRRLSASFPVST